MIIANLSIQPELVRYAEVRRERKAWILAIAYEVGEAVAELTAEYDDEEDARADLVKLDGAAKSKEAKVGFGVASEADTDSGCDVECEGDMLANGGEEYRETVVSKLKRAIGFR